MPRPTVDWSLYYVTARDDSNGLDDLDAFLDHLDQACSGVCMLEIRNIRHRLADKFVFCHLEFGIPSSD